MMPLNSFTKLWQAKTESEAERGRDGRRERETETERERERAVTEAALPIRSQQIHEPNHLFLYKHFSHMSTVLLRSVVRLV